MATSFYDPAYMEAVFAALFEQLKTATFAGGLAINTFDRAFKAPDDVPVAGQPALVMIPGPQHVEQKEFALAKWTFTAIALIYFRGGTDVCSPQTAIDANFLLWGIVNALSGVPPPAYEKQTLGGLVYHCWIEGEVTIEILVEQAMIGIPIFIIAGDVG
jgi:hypothetical protein